MKKILAMILVIATLAALAIIPVSADDEEYPEGLTQVVIMKPDDGITCLDGTTPVSRVRFVFGSDCFLTGLNAQWKLVLYDENGEQIWVGNCDTDEDILVNGVQMNTTWSMSTEKGFKWGTDTKGYCYFDPYFQIPTELLDGKSVYDLAAEGRIAGYFGDYDPSQHAQNGLIDCDSASGILVANEVIDGLDVCYGKAMTEVQYYGENGDVADPDATDAPADFETEYVPTTKAPETEASATEAAATEAAGTTAETVAAEEEKSGCGSVAGIAALALLVLAAPAVCKKH